MSKTYSSDEKANRPVGRFNFCVNRGGGVGERKERGGGRCDPVRGGHDASGKHQLRARRKELHTDFTPWTASCWPHAISRDWSIGGVRGWWRAESAPIISAWATQPPPVTDTAQTTGFANVDVIQSALRTYKIEKAPPVGDPFIVRVGLLPPNSLPDEEETSDEAEASVELPLEDLLPERVRSGAQGGRRAVRRNDE
ncbi:hypothetical protein FB451DRAFT_1373987 [Mycena latifolia]|nr:hypothetical protein FB451DRAFT_1373987 [Mycena latifolia]